MLSIINNTTEFQEFCSISKSQSQSFELHKNLNSVFITSGEPGRIIFHNDKFEAGERFLEKGFQIWNESLAATLIVGKNSRVLFPAKYSFTFTIEIVDTVANIGQMRDIFDWEYSNYLSTSNTNLNKIKQIFSNKLSYIHTPTLLFSFALFAVLISLLFRKQIYIKFSKMCQTEKIR